MRMVFVPGFTQTASSWSGVLSRLPLRAAATAVEIPKAPTFEATVDALANRGGHEVWIGYSMGGRLSLGVAVKHPERVRALVLISSTAGIEKEAERHTRVLQDDTLARDVETRGVDAFLKDWLAQPMFATVPPNAPGLSDRRTLSPASLAHQLRALGPGRMPSYWNALHRLRMPVLLITGTLDKKFDAINTRMANQIPGAQHVRLKGGHALPLEVPGHVATTITEFVHALTP